MLNRKKSIIFHTEIEDFIALKMLDFRFTFNKENAYKKAAYDIIANRNTEPIQKVVKKKMSSIYSGVFFNRKPPSPTRLA